MRGSILLLCLVFMASLSLAAMTALKSALSAQGMTSAYLSHHRATTSLEQQLIELEHMIWAHWRQTYTMPDAETLAMLSSDPVLLVFQPGLSAGSVPGPGSCGPLFSLLMQSDQGSVPGQGRAAASVRWDICCDLDAGCAAPENFRRMRYWARQLWSEQWPPATAAEHVNN